MKASPIEKRNHLFRKAIQPFYITACNSKSMEELHQFCICTDIKFRLKRMSKIETSN
jgi:hypothetical protein